MRECEKVFHQKRHLNQHKQIHSGTWYPCTLCDKTFSAAYTLKKHKEVHAGTFSHAGNLKTHIREQHGHASEPEDTAAGEQEYGRIHSFIVKFEDDSEEEDNAKENV